MNKEKLLILLVSILLIMNVVMVAMFYKHSKRPKEDQRRERMPDKMKDERIISHFGFDEAQVKSFLVSKEEHNGKIMPLKESLNEVSKEYYHLTNGESDKVKRDSLLLVIEDLTKGIYKINLQHFDDIRALCNEKQLDNLDTFISELLNEREGGPGHRKGGPPRPRRK